MTSHQENFGNAVLESLACGTPVLISDQVNLCVDIEPNGMCLTCTTTPSSIAEKLKLWHNEPDATLAMREHGPSFVRENFAWDAIATRWASNYQSL